MSSRSTPWRAGATKPMRSSTRTLVVRASPRTLLSAALRARRPALDDRGIVLGSRVRVLTGPFEGKVGIIQELDGNGGARVLLGLMVTRVDLAALILDRTHLRRSLASSHRG